MSTALIQTLVERRTELLKEAERLVEGSSDQLTGAQTERFAFLTDEAKALAERIEELRDSEVREAKVNEAAKRVLGTEENRHRLNGTSRTYSPSAERAGISFLRDVANVHRDPGAAERLARHSREALDEFGTQYRDVGTGAFAGLTVPQYLTDLIAPARRAGRPTADICNVHPLADDGMTVNISRITTGAATVSQATENAAVVETDMDDTLLTANVVTIAGMQDVSRQAVDRSAGVDQIVIADLARAYNTELDRQIINSAGTGGQHLGIRSTSGIISVAYTDATPTGAELYPKLADLSQQIQTAVFLGVSHFVMHPRRWWWLAKEVGTTFPLLQLSGSPDRMGGVLGTGTYESGMAGVLATVPVILDANIPTNLGGGTNEDVILGVTSDELHLWEAPDAPMFIRSDEALSLQLSVRFVLWGYTAFTAGRYPAAHGTIGGTGLITPSF